MSINKQNLTSEVLTNILSETFYKYKYNMIYDPPLYIGNISKYKWTINAQTKNGSWKRQ